VNPKFSSLNIASAVQVLAYECSISALAVSSHSEQKQEVNKVQELATVAEMEAFYQHLEETLIDTRYLDPEKPRLLMRKLRCLYGRIQPSKRELNILRGTLSAAQGRKFLPRKQRGHSH